MATSQMNHFNYDLVALLKEIKTQQMKLGLMNRAVIQMLGGDKPTEDQFFTGSCQIDTYVEVAQTLSLIVDSLTRYSVDPEDFCQQLRALPMHNIFLRNRYAFWLQNFATAGGTVSDLLVDARKHDQTILEQIVWSCNRLISKRQIAHLTSHGKQLLRLDQAEYALICHVMKRASDASPLIYLRLEQLAHGVVLQTPTEFEQYWEQPAQLTY